MCKRYASHTDTLTTDTITCDIIEKTSLTLVVSTQNTREGIIYSIYTHTGITSSAIYGGGGTYSHERIHWWADLSSNGQKSSIPPCWSIVNDIKSPTFNMFWSVQQNLIVLRFDAIIIYASFEGWKVCFIKIKVTTCVQWWDPIRVQSAEQFQLHSQNYVMTTVLMQGWGCLGSYCKMLFPPVWPLKQKL